MKSFEDLSKALNSMDSLEDLAKGLSDITKGMEDQLIEQVSGFDNMQVTQDALFNNPQFLCDSIQIQLDSMLQIYDKYNLDRTVINEIVEKLDEEFEKIRELKGNNNG